MKKLALFLLLTGCSESAPDSTAVVEPLPILRSEPLNPRKNAE